VRLHNFSYIRQSRDNGEPLYMAIAYSRRVLTLVIVMTTIQWDVTPESDLSTRFWPVTTDSRKINHYCSSILNHYWRSLVILLAFIQSTLQQCVIL